MARARRLAAASAAAPGCFVQFDDYRLRTASEGAAGSDGGEAGSGGAAAGSGGSTSGAGGLGNQTPLVSGAAGQRGASGSTSSAGGMGGLGGQAGAPPGGVGGEPVCTAGTLGCPCDGIACGAGLNCVAGTCREPVGLVGHWPLDGNLVDSGPSAHHGSAVGTITFVPGIFGQAAVLDGSSYIDMGDVLDPELGSYTAMVWFRRANTDAALSQVLFGKGVRQTDHAGWTINLGGSTSAAPYEPYQYLNAEFDPTYRAGQMHPDQVLDTEWRHYALVIDRHAEVTLGYLDGSNAGWTTSPGVPGSSLAGFGTIDTARALRIGSVEHGADTQIYFANGSFDDARIYDRALTAQEIVDTMNGSSL